MDLFSDEYNLRHRHMQDDDDLDPMASVANISDAMLVFTCGILVSVVLAWNLEISDTTQIELDPSQRVDDIENVQEFLESNGESYIERGVVYQDPNTGTLYMLESEEGKGAQAGTSQDSATSGDSGQ